MAFRCLNYASVFAHSILIIHLSDFHLLEHLYSLGHDKVALRAMTWQLIESIPLEAAAASLDQLSEHIHIALESCQMKR